MKLIVGLGNVGPEYEATRHNVGFLVVRELGRKHRVRWERGGGPVHVSGDWKLRAGAVRLLLPSTMMNRSGEAVTKWDISPADLLVVCDDVNLPLGALRLRPDGGAGGHHGLASCVDELGTEEISRLRVGVGVERLPADLTEFVLTPFEAQEQAVLRETVARAVEACELWVMRGVQLAMNMVNVKAQ